jgi:hypothetical protein
LVVSSFTSFCVAHFVTMMDAEPDGVPPPEPEQDRMVNDATENESPPPRLMITKMVSKMKKKNL